MKRYNNIGTTLIELLIVIAILGIIGGTFFKNRTENTIKQKQQVQMQKASWLLQSQAEVLRTMPFDRIMVTQESPFNNDEIQDYMGLHTAKGVMTVKNLSTDLKRIDLKIAWHTGSISHTIYRYRR